MTQAEAGPRTVVVGPRRVFWPGRRDWPIAVGHVGQLVEACERADVVLVHGDAHRDLKRLPEQLAALPIEGGRSHPFIDGAVAAGWDVDPPHLARWLKVRRGGRWTSVLFLAYDAEDNEPVATPWSELSLPRLVRGLAAFEGAVGMPWRDSVGRTVEQLILTTHPRDKGGVLMDRRPTIPPPCELGTLEQPFTWRRPLTDNEAVMGYVHGFDQNAQYLAAWQSVELGLGEPEHLERVEYSGKSAGVWRVDEGWPEILAAVELEVPLPKPWNPRTDWFTTPTMTRIAELLDEVPTIAEAYVWPRHSRFLRAAGERLRDARAALLDDPDPAPLDAVKACYRRETGRFNMRREGRERSQWHRPDWGHTIRAQARVNLHRRLEKLTAVPFAIATDGLLFTSDEPDPRAFAASIDTPERRGRSQPLIGSGLGQFQLKGSWKLDDERLEQLQAATTIAATYKLFRTWERAA